MTLATRITAPAVANATYDSYTSASQFAQNLGENMTVLKLCHMALPGFLFALGLCARLAALHAWPPHQPAIAPPEAEHSQFDAHCIPFTVKRLLVKTQNCNSLQLCLHCFYSRSKGCNTHQALSKRADLITGSLAVYIFLLQRGELSLDSDTSCRQSG